MAELAINGGVPIRDPKVKPWPVWPIFGAEERDRLLAVFESGKWWYGDRVKEFEEQFASFQDAEYGVTCTNGTAALEMALLACGIGAGCEVIIPPYTFIATASAVMKVNAIPVFADIDINTCNLDPADVEAKITEKTKAVIPVHVAGLPVDMDAFNALGKKYNLKIIEDACHSWGSQWKGKGTGALGNCGVFSFQMSKNITSGEGGILLSDDEETADAARSFANCGRVKTGQWYEHYNLGSNLRMTEFQAAILLGQLTRLEKQTMRRQENGSILDAELENIDGIELLSVDARVTRRAYHMYVFRFIEEAWKIGRLKFIEIMNAEGIPVSAGYPPLYRNPLFQAKGSAARDCPASCGKTVDYSSVSCPNAEKASTQTVWIPHHVLLAENDEMNDIVKAIKKV